MAKLPTILTTTAALAVAMSAAGATIDVGMANRMFNPAVVFIQPGDTVLWTNNDPAAMPHTVTSGPEGLPDGLFDSGRLDPPQTFSFQFNNAGGFPYYCDFHGGMTGTVVVGPVVRIEAFAFSPVDITINEGETVTWINLDTPTHTSTSDTGVWDSGSINPGLTFSQVFPTAGTYPYHCRPHPFMTGTVTVNGAPVDPVLDLVKDPADRTNVRIEWFPPTSATMLHRGARTDLPNLPMLRTLVGPPDFDNGVVPPPSPDYYYQVQ